MAWPHHEERDEEQSEWIGGGRNNLRLLTLFLVCSSLQPSDTWRKKRWELDKMRRNPFIFCRAVSCLAWDEAITSLGEWRRYPKQGTHFWSVEYAGNFLRWHRLNMKWKGSSSAPSLASSQNQPLRCHSTFKAAWPTSQVLAPTGSPAALTIDNEMHNSIYSSPSQKYSKKMQTHHRSGECRPIFSVRRNCAYTSSLYIVRWVHIEFLFFLSSFRIEPYLIFEEMFVQLCLAKLQAKKKKRKRQNPIWWANQVSVFKFEATSTLAFRFL